MYFEGSEKKAEIIVDNTQLSLIDDLSDDFWATFVEHCNAQILSTISNDTCKAFLLSESSLFVWHDRLLILTCGVTELVKSVEYFIEHAGFKYIKHIIYQRKNEYFAHEQKSCFGDDIKRLNQYKHGAALRFGELDSHHNYVFHQDNNFVATFERKSYELVAYQIGQQASAVLTRLNLTVNDIRAFLNIEKLLPGFTIDDHVFEPYGYSLNAIKGEEYLTIHVTPQEGSSYVSFDSNINLLQLAPDILAVLDPSSFDILTFNEFEIASLIEEFLPKTYVSHALVSSELSNGCQVTFANFIKPQKHFKQAKLLDVGSDINAL